MSNLVRLAKKRMSKAEVRVASTVRNGEASDQFAQWGEFDGQERQGLDLVLKKTRAGVEFANGQVIGYDLTSVLRAKVFMIRSTTFINWFVLGQALLVFNAAWLVAFSCIWASKIGLFEPGSPLTPLVDGFDGYFSSFTGFVFAYFVFGSLKKYLTIKNVDLGKLTGGLVTLSFFNNQWIPGCSGEDLEFKQTVVRWGMANYALTCYYAIGVKPSEAVGQCVRKGYLTPDEALHIAKSGSSAVAPILWLWQLYETRFPEVGGVWGRLLPILQTIADGSVSITRSCSSYGLPPLPLAFIMSSLMTAQLFFDAIKSGFIIGDFLLQEKCTPGKHHHHGNEEGSGGSGGGRMLLSVAISHFALQAGARVLRGNDEGSDDSTSYGSSSESGEGYEDTSSDRDCLGTPKMVITIECLIIICTPVFYQGLLEFVRQISNPFGDDWIDLPTFHMQHGLDSHLQFFVNGKGDSKFDPGKNIKLKKQPKALKPDPLLKRAEA